MFLKGAAYRHVGSICHRLFEWGSEEPGQTNDQVSLEPWRGSTVGRGTPLEL